MNPDQRLDDGPARMALAATAGETVRANRPRWMIVLGALLLGAALLYLVVVVSARGGVASDVRSARAQLASLEKAIAEIEAFERERETFIFPENRNVISELTTLAQIAGLNPSPTFSERQEVRTGDVVKRMYNANVRRASATVLFAWLLEVGGPQGVDGLQINNFVITPEGTRAGDPVLWNAEINFERWETTAP